MLFVLFVTRPVFFVSDAHEAYPSGTQAVSPPCIAVRSCYTIERCASLGVHAASYANNRFVSRWEVPSPVVSFPRRLARLCFNSTVEP